MRYLMVLLIAPTMAFGALLPQLPPSGFADTEVTAHYRLAQPNVVNYLDFALTFNGTASNNVEVAFGCDADGDDRLGVSETEMIVGWRCGRYFIENFRTGEVLEDTNVGTNGVARSLDWHYRIRDAKTVLRSFAATNEVGAAFPDLSSVRPDWLYNGDWNLMRLTARGVDDQDEHFEVEVLAKGVNIILR